MSVPLEGIRVLDFTQQHMGPTATVMLADLGAEVIKVEPPWKDNLAHPEAARRAPDGFDSAHEAHNRGKKSIAVDLKTPEGKEVIYRLIPKVDVLAENFSAGVMDRLGLGYEDLSPLNPRLVYGSCTSFGPTGPLRDWKGMDSIFQAMSGIMWLQAGSDGVCPEPVQMNLGDTVGGILFSHSIVVALLARDRTGLGQKVESSGLGNMISLQRWRVTGALRHGFRWAVPHGLIADDPVRYFHRDSRGGWFVISLRSAGSWARFCEVIGREDLKDHPQWQSRAGRKGSKELEELLAKIFATRTRDEWVDAFQAHSVVAGPVYSYDDLADEPQCLVNEYIVPVEDPRWGAMKVPGVNAKFSATPAANPAGSAPTLGEHTLDVLTGLAGYGPDEVDRLKDAGTI
ncbi:MAG: CoA transferase [Dehalococcoidia bacterium]|jgi:crotonobetainyl-CoA:carnitine CoA-transferase CaiB-like acyl-CoA transferase|nr:CoA transferase [Dehalococcoidia bacterium]MDP6227197.1 CoA transferase [Dehalococcoidia bacterium]HJN85564.1 CoA transferase [Dehalococcoidia bacterium]